MSANNPHQLYVLFVLEIEVIGDFPHVITELCPWPEPEVALTRDYENIKQNCSIQSTRSLAELDRIDIN